MCHLIYTFGLCLLAEGFLNYPRKFSNSVQDFTSYTSYNYNVREDFLGYIYIGIDRYKGVHWGVGVQQSITPSPLSKFRGVYPPP